MVPVLDWLNRLCSTTNLTSFFASLIGGGIAGSLTGAWVAHFLTKRRDNQSRKANFLGFLSAWETKADLDRTIVNVMPGLPGGLPGQRTIGPVTRDFMEKRIELNEKARLLEQNYRGRTLAKFQLLTKALADMTLADIEKDAKQLLRAIRDLSQFVERA